MSCKGKLHGQCVIVATMRLTTKAVLGVDFHEKGRKMDFVNHRWTIGDNILKYGVLQTNLMEGARVVIRNNIDLSNDMNVSCKLQTLGNNHFYGSTGSGTRKKKD